MHNVPIDDVDHLARPVIALARHYPPGYLLAMHSHRRAQLLYGATGVMHVTTQQGNWLVPPQRAVWLPPGMPHQVTMVGVTTHSLYLEPAALPEAVRTAPCRVVSVSPLMRQLLIAAVEMPLEYAQHGRDGALIALLLHEIARMPALPLHIPLPADARLHALCHAFLQRPDIHLPPQQWAARLYMSLRSFSRFFQRQTGMPFSQWRQRAAVVWALARLAAGDSVTQIALELGYENSAAFSAMFRRVLRQTPSSFLQDGEMAR
ncbi:AraC family transcriptional regulator [Serratia rubidaea]|uniref:AraC family transcriptional regulator n=1 Tax=Serratia rubidaea TaxID=61652 RepID=UPI001BAE6632|nr:helix-turn-helix transcriptional regulator [Serratia rubidaea]MBS0974277.1 helix-turn-helix transcriptional regulator [Serratia rubidaea]UJD82073.1 AraC family transcriptional regulator [Serratia rubidaea]UJD86637.1 AraC family transcriptional regulator [Serratia rubidaea]